MKLYIMRHGTTCWNEKGITQGRTNNRLSKYGKSLTKNVAENHKNDQFDIIFCSPLMRTMQTANIINLYHNAKIIKDDRLIEIDQGIFSGRRWKDLTLQEKEQKNSRSKDCGMENYKQVYDRVKDFFEYIKKEHSGKNILVVTHNVTASMLEIIATNQKFDINNTQSFKTFDNAQIKYFEI